GSARSSGSSSRERTTTIIDAHGSPDEANSAMQNLVIRGADAIIDLVFPYTSLGMGLRAAHEEGVVVATWGGGLGDTVAVTNGSGGVMAVPIVEQMVKDMGGKGSVLALTYHTGQVARERELEFDAIVNKYPDIKVTKNEVRIPGYLQDGAEFASAWLVAHPEGSEPLAIWGSWDDPALGAIAAMRQQGRRDVMVYGQNGNIEAVVAVEEGWMTATAWEQSEEEGRVLVYSIKEALEAGDKWVAHAREVPVVVVNKDTVADFIKERPEAAGR
ncbi:MAG: sugar ABC transporter substrate-binding protein, partial [Planctomycetes bacterium]|nr:sugar ABC transporter substrate-binding protein [Planctomycetota bacterium]